MYQISFGSDNHSGAHQLILEAVANCNEGYLHGYGEEEYYQSVAASVASLFGEGAEALLVMTGTGANVLAIQSLIKSYEAVICADSAHINVHEAGAIQKFTQARLIAIPTPDGKLTPRLVKSRLEGFGDQHMSQPRILSISQVTEYGTVYSIEEIKALAQLAHQKGMFLHIDGARLANAAAALNVSLRELTAAADVVSFGGTKNGLLFGEALIFLNQPEAAKTCIWYRKQAMQLLSKMRYISAQYEAYLHNDLWLQNALQANAMAQMLAAKLQKIPAVTLTQQVKANSIFIILPKHWIKPLQEKYHFYVWEEGRGEIRLMCSFNTQEAQINAMISDMLSLC